MKILLFTEACAAGVGRHVMDLAEGLSASGHQCHIVYSCSRIDESFAARVADFPHAYELRFQRDPHPSDLSLSIKLHRYIRERGPFDILHAHSTKAGLILRLAAIGLPGAVVYTPHAPMTMNPHLHLPVRLAVAATEVALSSLTWRVIAVSEEESAHLTRWGVPASKISVVPNGIENSASGTSARRCDGPVNIGFLGRLGKQKNAALLLQAFADAFTRNHSAVLTIGGTGPEEEALRCRSHELGIADRVRWLGPCSADAMRGFDIFALPSSYEGMPYVLLEALRAGVPVAATAVGGVGSVIANGVQGFVVDPGNRKSLAQALRKLALDPILRKRMSEAAIVKAKEFSLERMISGTVAVYSNALRENLPERRRLTTAEAP